MMQRLLWKFNKFVFIHNGHVLSFKTNVRINVKYLCILPRLENAWNAHARKDLFSVLK